MSESGIVDRVEDRRSGQDRRSAGDAFVGNIQAADVGVSIARRWFELVVIFIGFGISIGMQISNNAATQKAFEDFRVEMRSRLDHISADATTAGRDVIQLRAELDRRGREVDALRQDVAENYKIMNSYFIKYAEHSPQQKRGD